MYKSPTWYNAGVAGLSILGDVLTPLFGVGEGLNYGAAALRYGRPLAISTLNASRILKEQKALQLANKARASYATDALAKYKTYNNLTEHTLSRKKFVPFEEIFERGNNTFRVLEDLKGSAAEHITEPVRTAVRLDLKSAFPTKRALVAPGVDSRQIFLDTADNVIQGSLENSIMKYGARAEAAAEAAELATKSRNASAAAAAGARVVPAIARGTTNYVYDE